MADRIRWYLVSSDRNYATVNGERFRLLFAISEKMLEKLTANDAVTPFGPLLTRERTPLHLASGAGPHG